jgi:hypothetical protein
MPSKSARRCYKAESKSEVSLAALTPRYLLDELAVRYHFLMALIIQKDRKHSMDEYTNEWLNIQKKF